GAEAAQTRLARLDQVKARGALVVRSLAHAKGRLGRDQRLVTAALQRRAENFFRCAGRIDIRGVEKIEPVIWADNGQSRRLGDIGLAPFRKQLAPPAERTGSETKHRNLKSGMTELPRFHRRLLQFLWCWKIVCRRPGKRFSISALRTVLMTSTPFFR